MLAFLRNTKCAPVAALAMAMLVVALSMSLIYLILDRALKTHKALRVMDRLPPLL